MTRVLAAVAVLAGVAAGARDDGPLTLAGVPPVVVKTVPEAGADDVDPAVAEIKVTFSKPMTDGTWSWSTVTPDSFPGTGDGKPRFLDDGKTCVLPVKLRPGKTYGLWVNSPKFQNFKDRDGHPAVPYLLAFRTKQ